MTHNFSKLQRSKVIMSRLDQLYPNTPIPLDHINDYTLLVAVILSAQSTDKKVNQITPSLFQKASNAKSMVELGEAKIHSYIKEIGLSKKKATYLFEMSKIVLNKYNCKIPNTFEELENLPGVGHKTASVVMAQAFNIPTFPVDTHIHRLSQRWGLTNGKSVAQTETDLKAIFPIAKWNKLHLQIIFYGREYCTARGCNGTICMLCRELFPNRATAVKTHKA